MKFISESIAKKIEERREGSEKLKIIYLSKPNCIVRK